VAIRALLWSKKRPHFKVHNSTGTNTNVTRKETKPRITVLVRISIKLLRCGAVKFFADKSDMRATQFAKFLSQNTSHEISEFIATEHKSVRTSLFMSSPPPSVHVSSCSDITDIVMELEADKGHQDRSINKKM
jgi:hypothetical protein